MVFGAHKYWREAERVSLEVADTPDPTLIGKREHGRVIRVYAATGQRTEAALVHLDAPITGDTCDVVVFRRNRPSLLRHSQFVYVIPWPHGIVDSVDSIDVMKRTIFIAELKQVRKDGD